MERAAYGAIREMEKVGKLLEAEGYALTSTNADRGTHSVVYHCRHLRPPNGEMGGGGEAKEGEENGAAVRVKVLKELLPLPRHLTNFQHEHKVVEALMAAGVPGIVHVRGRLSRPGLEALVLEDFGGRRTRAQVRVGRRASAAGQVRGDALPEQPRPRRRSYL